MKGEGRRGRAEPILIKVAVMEDNLISGGEMRTDYPPRRRVLTLSSAQGSKIYIRCPKLCEHLVNRQHYHKSNISHFKASFKSAIRMHLKSL